MEYDKWLWGLMFSKNLLSSTFIPSQEENALTRYWRGVVHAKNVHVIVSLKQFGYH